MHERCEGQTMRTINRYYAANALLVVAATAAVMAGGSESPSFDLTWTTVDAGGGRSTSGSLEIHGTIGQPDAGPMLIGGGLELLAGLWAASVEPIDTCPADLTGDGFVNITDLLFVVSHWGGGPGDPADVNSDNVVNILDLLAVVAAWGACP